MLKSWPEEDVFPLLCFYTTIFKFSKDLHYFYKFDDLSVEILFIAADRQIDTVDRQTDAPTARPIN